MQVNLKKNEKKWVLLTFAFHIKEVFIFVGFTEMLNRFLVFKFISGFQVVQFEIPFGRLRWTGQRDFILLEIYSPIGV